MSETLNRPLLALPAPAENLPPNAAPEGQTTAPNGGAGLVAPSPKKGLLAGLLALLTPTPALTPAERAELAAKRRQAEALRKLETQLRAEAEECAHLISRVLADLNVCHRRTEKGKVIVKRVRFDRRYKWPVTEEALYLPVDLGPGKRPDGVGVKDLKDPDILEDLSVSIGRHVDARYDEHNGFFYVVWRQEGARGIPVHVNYDDMLAARPASLDPLGFPLGLGEGKKPYWRSLKQLQSLIIAGTTGGGKSNMVNVILSTLIGYNNPAFFRVALVDWKRVELGRYKTIPHLINYQITDDDGNITQKRGFVTDPLDTLDLFEWLFTEMNRRIALLEQSNMRDIGEYNFRNRANRLSYIYTVVDEWAMWRCF